MHLGNHIIDAAEFGFRTEEGDQRNFELFAVKVALPIENHGFEQRIAQARRRCPAEIGNAVAPHIFAFNTRAHGINTVTGMDEPAAKGHIGSRETKRAALFLAMFNGSVGNPWRAQQRGGFLRLPRSERLTHRGRRGLVSQPFDFLDNRDAETERPPKRSKPRRITHASASEPEIEPDRNMSRAQTF